MQTVHLDCSGLRNIHIEGIPLVLKLCHVTHYFKPEDFEDLREEEKI